jgi:hypothetical protein
MQMKSVVLLLGVIFSLNAQAAIVNGSASGVGQDVGSTSKGGYVELIDSAGKLQGAAKTRFVLYAVNFTAATTEALITLTPSRDNVDGSTGTSHAVTAAKRLVLLGVCITTRNAGAAVQGVVVKVRVNPSGAATATSPIVAIVGAGTSSATANVVASQCTPISQSPPALYEISGTNQIGISQIGTATAGNEVSLWGYEY